VAFVVFSSFPLGEPFFYRLHLNDKHYFVEPPMREKVSSEEITKLGDVRSLVSQVRRNLDRFFHRRRLLKRVK
jgi:hypothetical protein